MASSTNRDSSERPEDELASDNIDDEEVNIFEICNY